MRTRRSDSCLASSSMRRISFAMSWRTSSSVSFEELLARLLLGHAGGALELAHGRLRGRLQLLLERARVRLAVADALLAALSARRASAPAARRAPPRAPPSGRSRCGAARAAPPSPARSRSCSSLAWSSASLRRASASRCASSSSDSAFRVSASARTPVNFFCRRNPTDPPTRSAATTATATTRTSTNSPLLPASGGVCQIRRRQGRAPVGKSRYERRSRRVRQAVNDPSREPVKRSARPLARQSSRAAEQLLGDVLVEAARAQAPRGGGARAVADRAPRGGLAPRRGRAPRGGAATTASGTPAAARSCAIRSGPQPWPSRCSASAAAYRSSST